MYNSMSTNFRLELIELMDFLDSGRERRALGANEERRKEHESKLARLVTASKFKKKKLLTLNLSSRRLYRLQAKISEQVVYVEL